MPLLDIETPDGKREVLRTMVLARTFENTVRDRFADGEIPGFVHLSQGQEATGTGAIGALEDDDYVTSTHRAHGHSVARGLEPDRMLSELYGKEPGYCRGKGGSMHVADLDGGMLGAQAIVGASAPLGVGAGITAQYEDADWVTLAFLGDGSVAAGQVHEAINFAATWELPVIFVIENNQYSEGMTFDEQHNIEDLADMAASYGIPGEIVDGQDVEAVYETIRETRERAVAGEGPSLVEAKTYRYRGHFEGDQQPYRSQEEVERWQRENDPIDNYRSKLEEEGHLSESAYEEIREEANEILDDALEFAREADVAGTEAAYEDVFVDPAPEIEAHRERLAREEPDWGVY